MTPTPAPKPRSVRLSLGLLSFSRHWLRVALVVLGIYTALPVITPVLMRLGITDPAIKLYTLYSPFCHQFAFRSLFLFGEQPMYPRAITGADQITFDQAVVNDPVFIERYRAWYAAYNDGRDPGPITLETMNNFTPWLQFAARDFVGNPQLGYKMTLCARDISIYTMLLLGGLIFALPAVRRRLRPIPIWLYLVVGVAPIAIDGFSQLLGYPPFNLWPPRETLPIFRLLTGGLFGLMTAWLVFPHLELSMRDTQREMEEKLTRANIPF